MAGEATRSRRPWYMAGALLTTVAALLVVQVGMARLIRRHAVEFDVYPFPDKLIGLALQRQAFMDPTLLPVYGSSELTQPQVNRADDFFEENPDGFEPFLIGNPGETCLIIATKLAALGPETRDQKAVVFLSPGWFLEPELDHKGFGVNFSPLHGNVFVFQSRLSAGLKRDLARRLLDYPETVGQSTLLDTGLKDLAKPTKLNGASFAVLRPMGEAQAGLQQELEYMQLWNWWRRPHPRRKVEDASAKVVKVDWRSRLQTLDKEYARRPKLTSYSAGPSTVYDDARRSFFHDKTHPELSPDDNFARACNASKEWTDLQLLLRVAHEQQIRLLVVCQPLNEKFGQLQGLTEKSYALFYDKVRTTVAPFKVKLATFPDREKDPQFYQDSAHPSGKGWITYDAALDTFFHEADHQTAQGVAH